MGNCNFYFYKRDMGSSINLFQLSTRTSISKQSFTISACPWIIDSQIACLSYSVCFRCSGYSCCSSSRSTPTLTTQTPGWDRETYHGNTQ